MLGYHGSLAEARFELFCFVSRGSVKAFTAHSISPDWFNLVRRYPVDVPDNIRSCKAATPQMKVVFVQGTMCAS